MSRGFVVRLGLECGSRGAPLDERGLAWVEDDCVWGERGDGVCVKEEGDEQGKDDDNVRDDWRKKRGRGVSTSW